MERMIAEEGIEIDAPVAFVWELLVLPDNIKKWSSLHMAFANDEPLMLGSEFEWINETGKAYAKGTVIEYEPLRLIRISAHYYAWKKIADPDALSEIYYMYQKNGQVSLTHTYSDFANVPNGEALFEKYKKRMTPVNHELEKIKALAEEW